MQNKERKRAFKPKKAILLKFKFFTDFEGGISYVPSSIKLILWQNDKLAYPGFNFLYLAERFTIKYTQFAFFK